MSNRDDPKDVELGGETYKIRRPGPDDGDAIHAFALSLPPHDLLYLRRDISQRPVVEAWLQGVVDGEIESLVVERGDKVVATSGLFLDRRSWSAHVGEIRVLVSDKVRGKGLGRLLIRENFLIALEQDLKKIIAQMTIDQKGARAVFEEMGFSGEALLKDHVRDRTGETHDILILSCDLQQATTVTSAYR